MPKMKVLFVDDNQMDRMILGKVLDEIGLETIDTKSPEEFLKKLKIEEPDICLIDLNIRQTNDGLVLVQAIRNIMGNELPIIVVSATEKSELISKSLSIGANDYICKPIDKSLLSSKISNYLKSRKINSYVLPLFRVPEDENRDCSIQFRSFIESVDETGIQFVSNHSVKENSLFYVENEMIHKMFRIDTGIEMRVEKTWEGESENVFHFYALFGKLGTGHRQKLRKFITDIQIMQKSIQEGQR